MGRERLDTLLVRRGLVESREKAQALIMAGQVMMGEQIMPKAGLRVSEEANLAIRRGLPYVSRGGTKLAHALDQFGIDVQGLIAMDVGASTGGFTDCLLQRGVRRVYAIDVGRGQLAYRLRNDPRVVVMEGINARYLEGLPEPVDLAAVDVSFISLKKILPAVLKVLQEEGHIIALVKPQFEAGREQVGKGGVVRDPRVHQEVLARVVQLTQGMGLRVRSLTSSPLRGPAGNKEFFAHLARTGDSIDEGMIHSLAFSQSGED